LVTKIGDIFYAQAIERCRYFWRDFRQLGCADLNEMVDEPVEAERHAGSGTRSKSVEYRFAKPLDLPAGKIVADEATLLDSCRKANNGSVVISQRAPCIPLSGKPFQEPLAMWLQPDRSYAGIWVTTFG
jgi:hypothetical protein